MYTQPLFQATNDCDIDQISAAELINLQSSKRLLSAVVQNTPECVKLITVDGTLLDMNPAGLSLIEADDFSSVQGANVYDLVAPEHLDNYREFNERVCAGSKESLEFELICLKGTRRWMHTTAVPMELPDGEVVHLAITREITENKRRQIELEEAKEKAEAASLAKSEFLANMSHEIRTPMTAILGFSDILLDNVSLKENVEAARTIKENGRYLLELINDILDLSKIEAGKVETESVICSPHKILSEVASLMRVRAAAKGLPLNFLFEGAIPESIQSDPTRFRQVLINIIGNAIKFTETGVVNVITRLKKDSSEPKLQIDVIDTGIGIDESNIDKLFSPFTQADSSTTRNYGGTGLGLSISKRLAELLGGDICVSSEKEVGSVFTVSIATGDLEQVRLLRESNEVIEGNVQRESDAIPVTVLSNVHVLLVEDGPDNQRLIKYTLKKSGAQVTIAENGQEAIDIILAVNQRGESFDVILMDMQMPVLDGYEATRQLREQGYQGSIIALTAHAMADDRQKCIDAGCDDYTTKPIDREVLLTTVAQYAQQTAGETL
ncbi:MAG: hypothetical protein COA78_17840 [Blastopirellula sp.]|nr:MAG: hypothetical protein COA78_17840 [Blastopirellula sp.]